MNKDAEGRWKVGMSNIKLKMRVKKAGGGGGGGLISFRNYLSNLGLLLRGELGAASPTRSC